MKSITQLIDTTLREGEQSPGVTFSLDQKKYILNTLAQIGVTEVELGIASPHNDSLHELINHCRTHHPQLQIALWCRCKKSDILHAASLRPDILSLSIPVSDIHLHEKIGKDREWAQQCMVDSIETANTLGQRVAIGFEDASRADIHFLTIMAILADQNGAERLRIADTVGIATPSRISEIIQRIQRVTTTCQIAIHTHNDFGMASANAIAAYEAGVDWIDVSVLGLGERSGCARLEEVAGYLALTQNAPFQLQHLRSFAHYVAAISRVMIDRHRPFLGEDIFTCETGIHLQGLQSNPSTYEPYPPEAIGTQRKLLIGTKSGKRAISQRVAQLTLTPEPQLTEEDLSEIRTLSKIKNRPLTDSELLQILHHLI